MFYCFFIHSGSGILDLNKDIFVQHLADVRQVAASAPEFQHNVGRESIVKETFFDENGALHIRTADGFWCPARLLEVVAWRAEQAVAK